MVILDISNDFLSTDSFLFGFKYKVVCVDAIFTLKSTISYFAERGSSVFVASIDISKAFDSVNHFKLYSSLLRVGIPVMLMDELCDRYSKYHMLLNGMVLSLSSLHFAVGSSASEVTTLWRYTNMFIIIIIIIVVVVVVVVVVVIIIIISGVRQGSCLSRPFLMFL